MVEIITIATGVATIKETGKPDITANKIEVMSDGNKVTIYARAGFTENTIHAPYDDISVNGSTFADPAAVVVAINAVMPSFRSGGGDGEGSQDVAGAIATHNASTSAHNDIRQAMSAMATTVTDMINGWVELADTLFSINKLTFIT